MSGYIGKLLHKFKDSKPKQSLNKPHKHSKEIYGSKTYFTEILTIAPKLKKYEITKLIKIVLLLFFYA